MLTIEIINRPSPGVVRIIHHKVNNEAIKSGLEKGTINTIGLIQGPLVEIITAGDVAEKTSNVEVAEIHGNCPQHVSLVGVFGDTASVSEAVNNIKTWEKRAL